MRAWPRWLRSYVVGPQAYHEILPSSRGTNGTGVPGFSELWTVMDAIEEENARGNRGVVVSSLNEEKKGRILARERIQPLAGVGSSLRATY